MASPYVSPVSSELPRLQPNDVWVTGGAVRDRGREGQLPGLPSLRTVRAVLPHTALQSVVLPARGLTERRMGRDEGEQPMLGEERIRPTLMVNQAEPFASSHTSFEGRQHALRPNRRFGPGPAGPDVSRRCSPPRGGHWGGSGFRRFVHHASTFLHPVARRALPRLIATPAFLTSSGRQWPLPASGSRLRASCPQRIHCGYVCGSSRVRLCLRRQSAHWARADCLIAGHPYWMLSLVPATTCFVHAQTW